MNTSGTRRATFHLIGRGSAWLRLDTARPEIALRDGDLVVLPHDAWHTLSGWPETGAARAECDTDTGTVVMCGYIDFGEGPGNPVLDALPEVVVMRSEDAQVSSRVDQLARPAPEPNSIRPMRLPLRRRSWPPRRGRWSRPAGG
ncbi:cupin domain-containing protein [Thiohalobacter thiocyanaticus]|uniref:cupin domain-containing protein n=1 Tax=Thiohalobacter thiocyanaticus TaxID=585455 RepID=UPI000BBAC035